MFMTLTDWIVIGVIVLIVGGALGYIVWAKKKGQKCIGCPDSKTCGGSCGSCSCGCHENAEKNEET